MSLLDTAKHAALDAVNALEKVADKGFAFAKDASAIVAEHATTAAEKAKTMANEAVDSVHQAAKTPGSDTSSPAQPSLLDTANALAEKAKIMAANGLEVGKSVSSSALNTAGDKLKELSEIISKKP